MSWNLSLKLNNLSNYVYSLFPTSSSLIINNINTVSPGDTLTITAGTIALNGTTSIGTGNITTANITTANTTTANTTTQYLTNLGSTVSNGATINLTVPTASTANLALGILDFSTYVSMKATSASSVLIALTVPSLPNGFLANGQSMTVSGVGAPWDGVYTVTFGGGITTTSNTYTLNNPSVITTGTTTTTLGTVSYLNSTSNTALGSISSNGLTINNLNGKLGIVGGTSNSGNVIFCNNTTSTTGNFDLLTDSNQHLRFAGSSNLLTIGGATNGGIAIPGSAGSIVCNQYTTNANTKMILNSTETANGIIEIQRAGVKTGIIDYANSSFPLQLKSESGISLDTQANGGINIACDGTGVINLIAQSAVVRASFGGTSTTIGSIAAQGMTFVNASGNAINFYTSGYNIFQMGTINCAVSHSSAYGAGYDFITFYYNSVAIGSVHQFSSGAITINYSSDYRLKENIQPINDCITVLNKLKPISFNWKDGGEYTLGFLAHEFAEVFPNNVVGQKDAVDADGKIKSQQMSDNCCIPLLVSCVQDQQKQIDNQQKQIDELKLLVNQLLNK